MRLNQILGPSMLIVEIVPIGIPFGSWYGQSGGFFRVLSARRRGDGAAALASRFAARPFATEFRLDHLRRRRLHAHADARIRAKSAARNRPAGGAAPDLRGCVPAR